MTLAPRRLLVPLLPTLTFLLVSWTIKAVLLEVVLCRASQQGCSG
jgi:hypothetical protein